MKQLAFNKAMEPLFSQTIHTLNQKCGPSDQTLREIMLTMPCKNQPNSETFNSVNKTWNDPTKTVFNCVPKNLPEARETINALIPRLRYECGDEITKTFNPDAVKSTAEVSWDPHKQIATSPADEEFEGMLDANDKHDFVETETKGTPKETLELCNIGTT